MFSVQFKELFVDFYVVLFFNAIQFYLLNKAIKIKIYDLLP